MHISHETNEEIETRLHKVIINACFKQLNGSYVFEEFQHKDFEAKLRADTLALVRDNDVWSQLVPCVDNSKELFAIFSFHFEASADNSGFVGWLASHLKQTLGTGVFVLCGQNSTRGGIFDYWGCPSEMATKVFAEIHHLMNNTTN